MIRVLAATCILFEAHVEAFLGPGVEPFQFQWVEHIHTVWHSAHFRTSALEQSQSFTTGGPSRTKLRHKQSKTFLGRQGSRLPRSVGETAVVALLLTSRSETSKSDNCSGLETSLHSSNSGPWIIFPWFAWSKKVQQNTVYDKNEPAIEHLSWCMISMICENQTFARCFFEFASWLYDHPSVMLYSINQLCTMDTSLHHSLFTQNIQQLQYTTMCLDYKLVYQP